MTKHSPQNIVRNAQELSKPVAYTAEVDRQINPGLISFIFLMLYIFTMQLLHAQDCTGFRTQTQRGWGANPNGNNQGTYLTNNFAKVFPSGLTIGCDDHLLILSNAEAVRNFSPSSTSPEIIPAGTITDPGTTYKNALAGHLEAAILNLSFDSYDLDFSTNSTPLGDLIIVRGTFSGWTVSKLVVEANNAIGGCSQKYSIQELNDALISVNNNYDNGTTDYGYLTCEFPSSPSNSTIHNDQLYNENSDPNHHTRGIGLASTDNINLLSAEIGSINIYPNPAGAQFTYEFDANGSGTFNIAIENLLGQIVYSTQPESCAGSVKRDVNITSIQDGMYILHFYIDGKEFSKQLNIQNTN